MKNCPQCHRSSKFYTNIKDTMTVITSKKLKQNHKVYDYCNFCMKSFNERTVSGKRLYSKLTNVLAATVTLVFTFAIFIMLITSFAIADAKIKIIMWSVDHAEPIIKQFESYIESDIRH